MSDTIDLNGDLLNSWKEISQYVGRGVRTVQRWERDFAFPVRRPSGHLKSAVVALRSDIDRWIANRDVRCLNDLKNADGYGCVDCARLRAQVERLRQELDALRVQRNVDGPAIDPTHPAAVA